MRIAFIVGPFPALSKTFIIDQITGLIDLGHEVDIYNSVSKKESFDHPDVLRYDLPARTYRKMPADKIRRVIEAIKLIIKNYSKNPKLILKSLNPFIYGTEAVSLQLLYTVVSFLDKKPYDIIHCHFGPNGNIAACLKQLGFQGKLVTTFHGYDIRLGVEKGSGIYRRLFEYGDCFLSISDYNYKNLVKFGADPDKILYHPVGINMNKFPFKWQSSEDKTCDPIVILTVARLAKEKGLKTGIRAVAGLIKQKPDLNTEYRIVGGGPLQGQLKGLVEELRLEKNISFLGPMDQRGVVSEMLKSHIFLLPSIAEALPVSLMEAQSVGLPVVATDVGSVFQVIVDGETGFLVPKEDVDKMAVKLKYLVEHPEIWQEMGKAGREFIEKHYDNKRLNRQLVEIYEKLIGENK